MSKPLKMPFPLIQVDHFSPTIGSSMTRTRVGGSPYQRQASERVSRFWLASIPLPGPPNLREPPPPAQTLRLTKPGSHI
jgi:hypothetical protein